MRKLTQHGRRGRPHGERETGSVLGDGWWCGFGIWKPTLEGPYLANELRRGGLCLRERPGAGFEHRDVKVLGCPWPSETDGVVMNAIVKEECDLAVRSIEPVPVAPLGLDVERSNFHRKMCGEDG